MGARGIAAYAWCACALVFAITSAAFDLGCSSDPDSLGRSSHIDMPADDAGAAAVVPKSEPVITDAQALGWLHDQCVSCHGPQPSGKLEMTWPMPVGLTREWLEVSEATIGVYESLRRKMAGASGTFPSPMPPVALDDASAKQLSAVVRWFEAKLPFTVAEADARWGRKPRELPAVATTCQESATLRDFIARFTNAALERAPTAEEYDTFTAKELDAPVTHEQRAVLVSKLTGEWKQEFRTTGLFKLAGTIGSAGRIDTPSSAGVSTPRDALPAGLSDDLDNELYALVAASYDSFDYNQYFLANTVMTTPRTAPLYGCPPVTAGVQACDLRAPRAGFFTTLGFLNTRPQTFLSGQNNTGRVQAMFLTLVGEGMPRTGKLGDAAPKLPDCIDTNDTRFQQGGGGSGTTSAIQTGAYCQGCHLGRGIAAGSVLFRPFSTTGLLYDPATLGAPGTPDADAFAVATSSVWSHKATPAGPDLPVDATFLRGLLTAPPKACVATGDPSGKLGAVSDVGQLAATFMSDRHAVARGFTRHAQRAFGRTPRMTLEMANRVIASFDAGRTKLGNLVEAYFMADSYACASAQ